MEIKTIRYLPKHIANLEEYKQITHSYDEMLKLLWDALDLQLKNLDMTQMDEATCDRWAKLLGVAFYPGDSIEDKRRIIRGQMASGLPYTERKIKEVITSMLGSEDLYVWELDRTAKTLSIGIRLASVQNIDSIRKIVRGMAPADVDIDVYICFNRWSRFQTETWETTWNEGADTWSDVRENAKWQEVSDD